MAEAADVVEQRRAFPTVAALIIDLQNCEHNKMASIPLSFEVVCYIASRNRNSEFVPFIFIVNYLTVNYQLTSLSLILLICSK